MFPKILGVIILTIIIATFGPTRVYAIPFFVIASAAVFVVEGVRVVPQQSAWVVERLGRFHAYSNRASISSSPSSTAWLIGIR